MMRKHILSLFACCLFTTLLFAQTTIEGTVTDPTGLGVIQANVLLFKDGNQVKGTVTDFDGNYIFSGIDGGTYDIEVSYLTYATQKLTGIVVNSGSTTRLNFDMQDKSEVIEGVVIKAYKVPLLEVDKTSNTTTITSEGIRNLGLKSVGALAGTSSGLSTSSTGSISIRGSRSSGTNYYVDGIRVSGLLPVSEIEQLQVITGGLGAEYGDVTGGVISLTSKGPSSRFSGAVEAETSQFLDPYGYNFANVSLSGPIIRAKAKEGKPARTILGFRLAAQYQASKDGSPSAVGVYRMPLNVIEDLEANPVYFIGGSIVPRAELLGSEVLSAPLKVRPNEEDRNINLTGKLDARLSEDIDVSISGIYRDAKDRFTPGNGWYLLNYNRNPYRLSNRFRVIARWRHKLGKQGVTQDEEKTTSTVIRNASYTLLAGYETSNRLNQDLIHKDKLFNYGQYGTQKITQTASITPILNKDNWFGSGAQYWEDQNGNRVWFDHQGYREIGEAFVPLVNKGVGENNEIIMGESPNPVLSRYQFVNGRLLGAAVDVWGSSYFDNVGRVYNVYSKSKNDRITANVDAQFDILPNGSYKSKHNIRFGAIYEERNVRSYSINPRELWTLARLEANSHMISGVDTTQFTGDTIDFVFNGENFKFAEYKRLIEEDTSKLFYSAIRKKLGYGLNDWVNIDGPNVDASSLSLDMFSVSELINNNLIGLDYYGYDYLGNEVDGIKFEDFFTAKKDGRRLFPVASVRPTYIAGYIQDKFSYKDIILRLGVRAEYYDANTKVMKDPYSLYAIETAEEFYARNEQPLPENVDPSAKVYVNGEESNSVLAYRKGDQWFDANGTATEGKLLFSGQVFPSYVNQGQNSIKNDITSESFVPSETFEDYQARLYLSPRISLSFPISESAGFFAHYDELVQRPSSNTTFTALDYYFFENIGRLNPNGAPANNPNLKPQKTIDYEVGFQQKLTDNTAVKLSAYYRENRDMIQSRYYRYVSITSGEYLTYGNIDFGTVKGFTVKYDFRRMNNLEFNLSYSLQFAEGTGSSSNSGLSTRNGIVRVLVPLSFDERHRLVGNIDYRYGSGKQYVGPKFMGVDLLSNTGLNLQFSAVSGRPYTRYANPNQPFRATGFTGDINGDRLPWNFNIDARLDRNFNLFGNTEKGRRGINLNVYFRASNLLNTKNVVGVYSATGSPEDDGYLNSSFGQDAVRNIQQAGKDVQNFLAAYKWAQLRPGYYSLPRRLYVGAIIDF